MFAEKIRPTDQRKALLEARDTELVTAGGVEAGPRGEREKEAEVGGSITRGERDPRPA